MLANKTTTFTPAQSSAGIRYDNTPNVSEWLPMKTLRTWTQTRPDVLKVSVKHYGSEKVARINFVIGLDILAILKVDPRKDKILLLRHPDDSSYFMLVKSDNGYTLSGHTSSFSRMSLAFHHESINNVDSHEVQYSIHPNNTITFRLLQSSK